jgi:PKD repeat protein
MGTIRWIGAAVVVIGLGSACGKDSNNPGGPGNEPPTASFTSSCTDLDCTFTDLSTDADGTIGSRAWNFGDNASGSGGSPSHSYGAAGDFSVKLTVTDNDGDEGSVTKVVTVTPPPAPGGPTAKFKVTCFSLDCAFQDQSTGTGLTYDWQFGDGATSTAQSPHHHFDATTLKSYKATLTVTDANSLSSSASQEFTVAPPATLTCNGVACTLKLDQASTVKVTLESASCTAHNNTFVITAPATDTLFKDGCYSPTPGTPGATFDLNNGNAYDAGTELAAEVISGSLRLRIQPALHVEGSFPTWTLKFDDGEDATPPDEPDFNDLIITVTATPQ